jgi:non-specific protein-tyrosine kinase
MSKDSLITLADPRSAAAEAFRTLRTNLLFADLEKPLKTLLVTSASPDGDGAAGKSTALANLAVVMAQSGRRILLVDCDLRRPRQHEIFGVAGQPGLSDMIAQNLAEAPLAAAGVEGLRLLPAGTLPPNPADLLSSRRIEAVIEALKAQADTVLFDAPPLLAVSDGALLASKLDGTLLVIHAGHTRREHAQRAKDLLEKIHARIVGAVLANAALERGMSAY